jgi:hypothetical protein
MSTCHNYFFAHMKRMQHSDCGFSGDDALVTYHKVRFGNQYHHFDNCTRYVKLIFEKIGKVKNLNVGLWIDVVGLT